MEMIRYRKALAAVLSLPPVAWRRGAGPPRPRARLERLERLALSPQHMLHLVRLGEKVLLVASSPGGCVLLESHALGELERPEVRP
jgi:hypothetical protein